MYSSTGLLHQVNPNKISTPIQFTLIKYSYYGEGLQTYPSPSESYIVGLCTGLFAAAAISSSRSVVELLPVAIEAVLVAFRSGLLVLECRNRLELSTATTSSWSVVLLESREDAISTVLEEFCQAKVKECLSFNALVLTLCRKFRLPHDHTSAPSIQLA